MGAGGGRIYSLKKYLVNYLKLIHKFKNATKNIFQNNLIPKLPRAHLRVFLQLRCGYQEKKQKGFRWITWLEEEPFNYDGPRN